MILYKNISDIRHFSDKELYTSSNHELNKFISLTMNLWTHIFAVGRISEI